MLPPSVFLIVNLLVLADIISDGVHAQMQYPSYTGGHAQMQYPYTGGHAQMQHPYTGGHAQMQYPYSTLIRLLPHLPSQVLRQQQSTPEGQTKFFFPRPKPTPLLHQVQSGYYNELLLIPGHGQGFPWHILQSNRPIVTQPHAPLFGGAYPLGPLKSPSGLESILPEEHESDKRFTSRDSTCNHFSDVGRCYAPRQCASKGGRAVTYCRDFTKFCCLFYVKCGDTSSEDSFYFRNEMFPLTDKVKGSCKILIQKKNDKICYIKIIPKALTLPANIGFCNEVSLSASGIPGKTYQPLCGSLSNEAYTVDIRSISHMELEVKSDFPATLSWEIYVTQLTCSEDPGRAWPEKGTKALPPSAIDSSVNPPAKPKVPSKTHEKFKCGTHAPPPRSTDPFDDFEGQSKQEQLSDQVGDRKQVQDNTIYNPDLSSLDWEVPDVSDSILAQYAGSPLPVSGRITYGMKTFPGEFPWSVAMYRRGRYHCGGSLISDQHVMTAAHCVSKYKRNPFTLSMDIGYWNINTKTDQGGFKAKVDKIMVHPGYSTVTLQYDLAILKLKEKVQFTSNVRPVCLPPKDLSLEGKLATVTGWGRNEHNKLQPILMKHKAAVVTNQNCNAQWKKKGAPDNMIASTMMCMNPQDGDSCKGDSGGPSVVEHPPGSGIMVQCGVVSFGSASCTDRKLPGVYTRVNTLVDWIEEQLLK